MPRTSLKDLATLPARLAVAAARRTLALGRLTDREDPIRRRGGYADRTMLIIASVETLNHSTRPLGKLANKLPGSRRRQALEA